jgi:hypothetical protein
MTQQTSGDQLDPTGKPSSQEGIACPAEPVWKEDWIERAEQAFEREAEGFVADHQGEWVGYHGDRRVGFGRTRAEVSQECLRQGLPEGEFWVFNIQPVTGEEALGMGGAIWSSEDS